VVGHAGTGKSAMLGVAREAWETAGYEVRGGTLSGIAAENLESGSGITSRTIASLEHGWGKGRDLLTNRDVLVIDEAGISLGQRFFYGPHIDPAVTAPVPFDALIDGCDDGG
jgi:ATP-dependent exoDNAse (exonuclease V) alpha subunit